MPAQRATCEPCRLRRVKCDLRDNASGCSNCVKRNLTCPGVRSSTPRKHRRGVVIDRIKQDYGQSPSPGAQSSAGERPSSSAVTSTTSLDAFAITSNAEYDMVSMELRREVNVSMLESFLVSHGKIFQHVFANMDLENIPDLGRRLTALSPVEEVSARVFVALGARTTSHPAILAGGDMAYPLTLGIVREEPCRKLAMLAIGRYETLGIWRQPTPEAIQASVMVYFIARSSFTAEFSRPFANNAVHLMRQYLNTAGTSSMETAFARHLAPLVLWADARCAAETGTRPLFTQDDLDDNPVIKNLLLQPLVTGVVPEEMRMSMLHVAMLRLLRSFATDFHLPIRRDSTAALTSLPRLWDEQTTLANHLTNYMGQYTSQLGSFANTDPESIEITRHFHHLLQVNLTVIYVTMSIWDLLRQAAERPSGEVWRPHLAEARIRALLELKRIATHIRYVFSLGEGPPAWVFMARMFHILENTPKWTTLLRIDPNSFEATLLTPEESQLITDGVQQSGWGAEFGSQRWLDVLNARGMLLDLLDGSMSGRP